MLQKAPDTGLRSAVAGIRAGGRDHSLLTVHIPVMSSECIFRTYFRHLIMLVWLGQHFKRQILPFLTTDANKTPRATEFLAHSLNKWPSTPLKITSAIPLCCQQECQPPACSRTATLDSSHSARTLSFCLEGVTGQSWTSRSQIHVQRFQETSGNIMKPVTELPHPTERRGSLQTVTGKLWYIFRKQRANSEHESVGRVSHGRRLVINTKESQNCELQPTSGSRGVSIQGCDSANLLSQAIPYQSQVTTKTICNDQPLLRWAMSLPPWFFVTTILLSHKMLTRQGTRKL